MTTKNSKENSNEKQIPYYAAPCPLVKVAGANTAIIYAYIQSREKLSKGYCYVSYPKMANELGMSVSTVKRLVAKLIKSELVIDITGHESRNPTETRHLITNPEKLQTVLAYSKYLDAQNEEND